MNHSFARARSLRFIFAAGLLTAHAALAAGGPLAEEVRDGTLSANSYRYFEGYYNVPGQEPVHYTVYAPLTVATYPAVLFLHGYSRTDRDWALHQIAVARRGRIGVAIDYDETRPQNEQLAEVRAAIRMLERWEEVSDIALVGTSWGGKVAFETLARYPELQVKAAFLVYPARPRVTPDEVAAIRADILNCVGEVDPMHTASLWIEGAIQEFNDQIEYRLHLYSAEEFPEDGRHGFFMAERGSDFGEVALDSFARAIGYFDWKFDQADVPPWHTDPRIITHAELLAMDDVR